MRPLQACAPSEGLTAVRSKLTCVISSEVQRTLVKSPPELWAEISDPESLARHLGEFGEIRITRVQPEQKVEWEADDASGTVVIKPSGWGTKVKLTVQRELVLDDAAEQSIDDDLQPAQQLGDGPERLSPDAAEGHGMSVQPATAGDLRPTPGQDATVEAEATLDAHATVEPEETVEPEATLDVQATVEPEPTVDPDMDTTGDTPVFGDELDAAADVDGEHEPALAAETLPAAETQPRRGFFSRLFARRRPAADEPSEPHEPGEPASATAQVIDQAPDELALDGHEALERSDAPDRAAAQPEPEAVAEPGERPADTADEAIFADADESQRGEVAAELAAAEEVATEQVAAVLSGVLDRLGAAHHRPFSRS
ncbi:MAG: hypothetical protein QOF54_100 [Solirubrobacteraceae bacterium]|jgi:hypothetical protein|nr:hypothetical protein [Solirubrobacteraceae bacterium]